MPNGKGSLECSYCTHWEGRSGGRGYSSAYEEGRCSLHRVTIASPLPEWIHRVCRDFSPDGEFARDNEWHDQGVDDVVATRLSWFGRDLEPNTLYGFAYNDPPGAWKVMDLPPAGEEPGTD
jgi:hypothetical protein